MLQKRTKSARPEPDEDWSDTSSDFSGENSQFLHTSILDLFPVRRVTDPGKEVTKEEFISVKSVFTCSICCEIFEEPTYLRECLHRFCKRCIEKSVSSWHLRDGNPDDGKKCPFCRTYVKSRREIVKDSILENMSTSRWRPLIFGLFYKENRPICLFWLSVVV
jgi:Zinc finger, C3HC4 type (RING finger)